MDILESSRRENEIPVDRKRCQVNPLQRRKCSSLQLENLNLQKTYCQFEMIAHCVWLDHQRSSAGIPAEGSRTNEPHVVKADTGYQLGRRDAGWIPSYDSMQSMFHATDETEGGSRADTEDVKHSLPQCLTSLYFLPQEIGFRGKRECTVLSCSVWGTHMAQVLFCYHIPVLAIVIEEGD